MLSPLIWTTGLERMLWALPIWLLPDRTSAFLPILLSSLPVLLGWEACVCAKSLQSCPALCNPMGCSPPGSSAQRILQQEHWSGLPCRPPWDLPDPGIKPTSFLSLALGGRFFITRATWEAQGWEDEMANGLELDKDLPFGRANS